MESMKLVRNEVVTLVDIDFFLNEEELNRKHEDEKIAAIIKGKNYERTQQKINDFISRCDQTLSSLQDRVNQTESEYDTLVSRARSEEPGSAPSDFFVDNKDPNSVARYNEKVNRYNNQVDLHRRIVDQANRAKERYEDAVGKYNEKKADLEEQVRVRLEELKPALDQDILALLGKLQQMAYDNIHNKDDHFAGFLLSYLTKKAYVFLYDYVENTSEQRAASDIFKKLDAEFDCIISDKGDIIKEGLGTTARYLFSCFCTNTELLNIIQSFLNQLPYDQCKEAKPAIEDLLDRQIDTNFEYAQIIDPNELSIIEENIKTRKVLFEQNIALADNLLTKTELVFDNIYGLKTEADKALSKMVENKLTLFDPMSKDIFFTLGFFDDEDQERYMKKHKGWIQDILDEIQKPFGMELIDLLNKTKQTQLHINTAKDLLSGNDALKFFANKEKIIQKKNQFIEAIASLNKMLEEISEQPKQKSIEFSKKMNLWLNISLLPFVNIGILFSIISLITQFLPALKSSNNFFVEVKNNFAKKFTIIAYIHMAVTVICLGISFVLSGSQILFWVITATYLISSLVIYLKADQFKKL